jgi:deoxycytidylate deaminase|tara:strand:- start:1413 stop:1757 length:345 start_codon:yes stop_codon:yes gene_type:complete
MNKNQDFLPEIQNRCEANVINCIMDCGQDNNANITLDNEMKHIIYEGKAKVSEIFPCQMCGKMSKFKYLKYIHPAIQYLFKAEEKIPLKICKICAKREVGSKNKKRWEKLHGEK